MRDGSGFSRRGALALSASALAAPAFAGDRPIGRAFAGRDIVMRGVEVGAGFGVGHLFGNDRAVGLCGRLGILVSLVALQQRIAFQLGVDEGLDLKIRHLQQLDRLLQLGRDDQPLALPYLQPLSEHRLSPQPGVARNLLRPPCGLTG